MTSEEKMKLQIVSLEVGGQHDVAACVRDILASGVNLNARLPPVYGEQPSAATVIQRWIDHVIASPDPTTRATRLRNWRRYIDSGWYTKDFR